MKQLRSGLALVGILVAGGCSAAYADSQPVPFSQGRAFPTQSPDPRDCGIERSPDYAPYGVDIRSADAQSLPIFHRGSRSYVMGMLGDRYVIRLTNRTPRRVEAIISVDGLDAIDGRPADFQSKRGYLVPAYGEITVEGFRTSLDRVAAFRFSSVADSYAGRKGQARDVGVVGVAFFTERERILKVPSPWQRQSPSSAAPPASAPSARESAGAGRDADTESRSDAPEKRSDRASAAREPERKGLGTEFGEGRDSSVAYTTFERQNPSRPASIVELWYNDRQGLVALGIPVEACSDDLALRETAEPFRGGSRFASPPPR